ncbi:hypothetical protein V5O48_008578 [Marasmius crinis-equi]|uniref:Uncharacterized protein n=1 Tax=Marasmius crinis-equi TaxID=585013 RepID=A0ABR3FDV2_9AGAR
MVIPEGSLHDLERRAINCPGGGKSPCVCNGQLGIKVSENKCPDGKFVFSKPTDASNGDMQKVAGGRTPDLQCDHVVEAQFVAKEFKDGSPMCNHFLTAATGKADFAQFKKVLNTAKGGNFVFLDKQVNNAKGKFIAGSNFNGPKKIALGVASYLTKTRSTAKTAAQALKDEMDGIAKKNNFQSFSAGFVNDYDALISKTINAAKSRAAKLPAAAPPSTAGKKRPAPGSPATPPAKKQKTTTSTAAKKKPATTAKKPAAKKPVAKKPAAKKPAAKKPAVKKAPIKKTTAKKAPIKKTAAKKAPVKKTAAKKKN